MKKLMLTICLLAGMVLCQGCSAGSVLSLRAMAADRLTPRGEQQLIQTIKEAHDTRKVGWHVED